MCVYDTNVCVWHKCVCMTQMCVYDTNVCVWHKCVCMTQMCVYDTNVCVWHKCVCMTQMCVYDTYCRHARSNAFEQHRQCVILLQCVEVRCNVFQRRLKRPILPTYICSVYTCINMFAFSTPYTCMHECVYLRLLYMYMQLLHMYRYVSIYAAPILIYICVYLPDLLFSVSMCVFVCSPQYIHTCRRIWPPFSVSICLYIVYLVSLYMQPHIYVDICVNVCFCTPYTCINTSMSVSACPCSVSTYPIPHVVYPWVSMHMWRRIWSPI